MTDTPPAVALLFDDTELGGHLRDALQERGARIVHEGEISSLSRNLLQQVGADVLVVNLDDGVDDALDQLYDMLDGDQPRVVFNDGQASRALVGWDRARWARHLAVKVLAMGDIDPPRPEHAPEVRLPPAPPVSSDPVRADAIPASAMSEEVPAMAPEPPATPPMTGGATATAEAGTERTDDAGVMTDIQAGSGPGADPDTSPDAALDVAFDADADVDFPALDDLGAPADAGVAAESEDLAAELEALLASGDLPGEEEQVSGPGLRFTGDEEPPPLHDGNFGVPGSGEPDAANVAASAGAAASVFDPDHMQLSARTDPGVTTEPADAAEPVSPPAPAPVSAPESWVLVDEETPEASDDKPDDKPDAAAFGIEKLSAAEFLAPDVEEVSPEVVPRMSLELVSMEEAIAPQAYVPEHEMLLDDLGTALSRIILLSASVDGTESVCRFLDALPSTTRLTFLLTHHLGRQSDAQLLERLSGHGPLPVRLADAGRRAGMGEVLMVPGGQQVRLRRDGSMELQAQDTPEPSIDASLTMAAHAFGRNALAIVFAGRGNDAVAGSQAIHDRGGQVWVESSSGEHFADMVSAILAERLVSFSGTPPELAARLIEVCS